MRRRLRILAIAVVAAAVIAAPFVFASRPQAMKGVSAVSRWYSPWAKSTHAEVACRDCHASPTLLSRAGFAVRVSTGLLTSAIGSRNVTTAFSEPTNRACLVCHSDLRSVSPKGDLQIPHRAHIELLKMRCVECHSGVAHDTTRDGSSIPPMKGCLRCHDGRVAKDACSACHTAKAAPASHKAPDWLVVHASAGSSPECVRCHKWAKNWCSDCHSHRPKSHGRDWRRTHGQAVAVHRDCEACHTASFCTRCHGDVPKLNFDPALTLIRR